MVFDLKNKTVIEDKRVNAINIKNSHPIVDWAKECTEGTGPPRLINIPI